MTEKLFYSDSYMQAFSARVCECRPSGETFEVVLDRTAFFPEGGGQAADTGMLDKARVLDVKERKGIIYHTTDFELEVGKIVEGIIDWEKRFSRMQQHTGEHIVSGLIHKQFGYNNVGFHLGEEVCTLDLSGPMTKEEIEKIESAANEVAAANLPVEATYPTKEELGQLEYRSKIEIEGQVRIITIPDTDVCACCAPHVRRTGEIGLIKFVHSQNYKGGVRLTMVCGFRALADYRAKERSVRAVMQALSAKEELIAEAVIRLKEECSGLKGQLAGMQRKVLAFQAEKIEDGQPVVCLFEDGLSGDGDRELMNLVLERNTGVCAVFTKTQENGYRYVIGSRSEDVRSLCHSLNERFHGRGGGRPEMVQGSLNGIKEEIYKFVMMAGIEKE